MKLPQLKPQKVIRALRKIGFEETRQSGSHLILVNRATKQIIPVPIHNKDIKKGLLAAIIKEAGLTLEKFLKLL